MFFKDIQYKKTADFKRLVGVKREVFDNMVTVVTEYKEKHRKHKNRGRPPTLSVADQVLAMLMYYREYRTFFHVGTSYGLSEGQCYRIIIKIEAILIASKLFHLPGKKKLTEQGMGFEVVIVDVTESPVERPKKTA
jgi:Helix-turn-helix of DDE superfamily endonuclease